MRSKSENKRQPAFAGRPFCWQIPLFLVLSLLIMTISLNVGYFKIPLRDTVLTLLGDESLEGSNIWFVIRNIRVPRILSAFFIGMGLSIAGASFQGMFKNPLVAPDILGVSHGAGLGAALALSMHLSGYSVQLYAFLFGIASVSITYFIGSRAKFGQDVSLVLAGSMLAALCSSLITMLKYLADPNDTLPAITYWLMGSLSKTDWSSFLFSLTPITAGCIVLYLLRWKLNLLTIGDNECMSMGVNPKVVRLAAIGAATVVSAAAVCLGGLIGWVGLMIPHLARGMVGADYRRLIPVTGLAGGSFLVLMDDLARSLSSMEIPLGVLTAIMGAPFFVIFLVRRGKS